MARALTGGTGGPRLRDGAGPRRTSTARRLARVSVGGRSQAGRGDLADCEACGKAKALTGIAEATVQAGVRARHRSAGCGGTIHLFSSSGDAAAPLEERARGRRRPLPLARELVREALLLRRRDPRRERAAVHAPALLARAGPRPGAPRARHRRLYAHQARAFEAARAGRASRRRDAHGERQEPLLSPARARRRSRDDPDARAIYLFPTKALARDQEAGLRELMARRGHRGGRGGLRRRHAGRRAARRARASRHRPHQPGHAPHRDPAAPHELGAHVAEPALRRRRRAPHVHAASSARTWRTSCGGSLRVARFHGSEPAAHRRDRHHRQPARARRAALRRRAEDEVELARRERRAARRAPVLPLQSARRERRSSASARAT